jgi:hypothetical protein
MAMAQRLLLNILGSRRSCLCGAQLDIMAEHAMVCRATHSISQRTGLHNKVQSVVEKHWNKIADSAGYDIIPGHQGPAGTRMGPKVSDFLEPKARPNPNPNNNAPNEAYADMGVVHRESGMVYLMDFTTTSQNTGPTTWQNFEPGEKANIAEEEKIKKYYGRHNPDEQVVIVPLAIETTGSLGKTTKTHIGMMADLTAQKADGNDSMKSRSYQLRQLKTSISVSLQGKKAEIINNFLKIYSLDTRPTFPLANGVAFENFPTPPPPHHTGRSANENRRFALTPLPNRQVVVH